MLEGKVHSESKKSGGVKGSQEWERCGDGHRINPTARLMERVSKSISLGRGLRDKKARGSCLQVGEVGGRGERTRRGVPVGCSETQSH